MLHHPWNAQTYWLQADTEPLWKLYKKLISRHEINLLAWLWYSATYSIVKLLFIWCHFLYIFHIRYLALSETWGKHRQTKKASQTLLSMCSKMIDTSPIYSKPIFVLLENIFLQLLVLQDSRHNLDRFYSVYSQK